MPPVATGSNGEANGAESSAAARRPSFDFRIQKGKPELSAAFKDAAREAGEEADVTPPNELVASNVSHDKVKHFFGK